MEFYSPNWTTYTGLQFFPSFCPQMARCHIPITICLFKRPALSYPWDRQTLSIGASAGPFLFPLSIIMIGGVTQQTLLLQTDQPNTCLFDDALKKIFRHPSGIKGPLCEQLAMCWLESRVTRWVWFMFCILFGSHLTLMSSDPYLSQESWSFDYKGKLYKTEKLGQTWQ